MVDPFSEKNVPAKMSNTKVTSPLYFFYMYPNFQPITIGTVVVIEKLQPNYSFPNRVKTFLYEEKTS